ncbi:MAG: DUF3833 domain-containing protein [Pseudomonadota bacterium]
MTGFILITLGMLISFALVQIVQWKWSFLAQTPADYQTHGPFFDIRERFNGPLVCEGVVYGPLGRVTSRFVAEFDAHWDGNVGVMKEVFRYDSGSVQHREWTLTVQDDGRITAQAPDLVGKGSGKQSGSSVLLQYTIKLTEDAGGHALNVTDWMYLMENGVIMNRSQFRKFGIKVAELVATMRPANMPAQALAA